jgi:hypothetical protein
MYLHGDGFPLVDRKVTDCSTHSPKGSMSIHAMKSVAWVIEVKKGKFIGFLNPEERKKKKIHLEEEHYIGVVED